MAFCNHREMNRKERATAELNTMCREYDIKCGAVSRYNINDLSPAQRKRFFEGKPLQEILKENV